MKRFLAGLMAAFALCASGCVSTLLAQKIVAPPNHSGMKPLFSDWDVIKHAPEVFADQWKVAVPAPRAVIAVAIWFIVPRYRTRLIGVLLALFLVGIGG